MKCKKYKCLVDKYGLVREGQEFLICGESGRDLDGNTLDLDTAFVEKRCDPDDPDKYEFEFLGEVEDTEEEEPEEETPKKKDPLMKGKKRFMVVYDDDCPKTFYTDEDQAKAEAEMNANGRALVVEVKSELKIKKVTQWEKK